MLFNKINIKLMENLPAFNIYEIDEHITIRKLKYELIEIYIDEVIVFKIEYGTTIWDDPLTIYYYYKIPRVITKKINSWAKNKINKQYIEAKNKKAKELNEKKKIEQHFKELYK